jgi:hypothetical protein
LSELQDLDIPDNIHTIFLNYVITLNMIKKELYFVSNSYKHLLRQMNPHMESVTEFMDGSNPLDILVVDEPSELPKTEPTSGSLLGFSFF